MRSGQKKRKRTISRSRRQQVHRVVSNIRGVEMQIADVLHQMQEKVRQLEYLTHLSRLLNSTLDTALVREKALEATCELLGCETASLLLVDSKRGELYWETALGESGKKLQHSVRLAISNRSIAGYVAMTGEKLIVNDVANDIRHFRKTQSKSGGFQTRNMLCVPLQVKGKTIGVLQAINKVPRVPPQPSRYVWPEFRGEDLDLLDALSNQVAIAVENSLLYERLKSSFYETVYALSEAIEKKDRYTGGHTKRVLYYSMCIAKYMNLSVEELDRVRLGAVLHDVGKIGIEDSILKKPAPLSETEWPVMKTHPELGWHIMKRVEGLKDVVGGMRFHHERWDGNGYPLGLKGSEIPLIARIIALADAYDAMVSSRPYRKGMDPKLAHDEIVRNQGTQFCPDAVQAFQMAFVHEKMGKGSGGVVQPAFTEEVDDIELSSGDRATQLVDEAAAQATAQALKISSR